eukprot:TRINITY_DN44427_c0_g1_i1.p1 TRINITY_DN44427_c0_g1~~TRINITY_DN44427_c0_g1_i1.p1  ORF type:complete len:465 (-),score=58.45 TRINITY_DN44427_c0_g1_i1:140-1501(-)
MGMESHACWPKLVTKDTPSQVCAVIRHAERADSTFALLHGGRWTRTDDYRAWPLDPPLSDAGEVGAQETAEVVHSFARRLDCTIDFVVSSPYLRCVQTAAVIAKGLGPNTKLMLDASVGEIFGPSVFGDCMPQNHRRPLQRLLDECASRGVDCIVPPLLGVEPCWPETVYEGRFRFAEAFLKYVEHSRANGRSFLVVTHGDCVVAGTSLFPMPARVRAVEPGGMLFASRGMSKALALRRSDAMPQLEHWKDGQSLVHRSPADYSRSLEAERTAQVFMREWTTVSFRIQFEPGTRGIHVAVRMVLKNMTRLRARSKLSQERLSNLLRAFADESCDNKHEGMQRLVTELPCETSSMESRQCHGMTRLEFGSRTLELPELFHENSDSSSEQDWSPRGGTPTTESTLQHEEVSESSAEDNISVRRSFKPSMVEKASTDDGFVMNFVSSPLWQRRVSY